MKCRIFAGLHSGKLTKSLVRTLGLGRHGDGNGLCASQSKGKEIAKENRCVPILAWAERTLCRSIKRATVR